jgi:hypothetical protein
MSNNSSKYKEDIIRLRSEGKNYLQIVEILKCSKSIVSYYSSNKQQENARLARKKTLPVKKINRKIGVFRNRNYVDNFLKGKSCVDCGNTDTRVLEFDHVRGIKEGHISHAVKNAWSIERLQKEIDKCEIRCCNCHRIVTIDRRNKCKLI